MTWPKLDTFIAFNVEETAGKRLRTELKAREKARPFEGYGSVSKLRKSDWWQSEFGRPFSGWNSRSAKAANAAYDRALLALNAARTPEHAKQAIMEFAGYFNGMKAIETTERDDIGEAVWQLARIDSVVALGVSEEDAQTWFDAVRDY